MAYQDLHVNGPAKVQVALTGSSYSDLGVTEDGVEPQLRIFHEDVITDDNGPAMATDVQFMGAEARIRLPMIRWDESTMRIVEGAIRSNTGGTFDATEIGTLLIAGSNYFSLRIQSSQRSGLVLESPITFPYAFPVDSVDFKLGTRVTRKQLVFRAIWYAGTLYTRG